MDAKPRLNYGQIFTLGFGFLSTSILWSVYNTYVPVIMQSRFSLGAAAIGFLMTLDNMAALFIQPMIGVVSDRTRTRIGRRMPYLLIGAPIAAVAFAFIPNARTFSAFIAAIAVMLLFAALYRTPVIALMPDLVPSPLRSQANGIINLMGGVGGVLAYIGGGLLYDVNPGLPFWLGAALTVIAILIVIFAIREPREPMATAADSQELADMLPSVTLLVVSLLMWGLGNWWLEGIRGELVKGLGYLVMAAGFILFLVTRLRRLPQGNRGSLLRLLLAIFCWFVGFNAIETFFSLYGVNVLHIKPSLAGILMGVANLTFIIFALPSGFIAARVGRRRTILWGLAIFSVLLLIAFFIPVMAVIAVALGLGGMAWALVNVNSLPMVLDSAQQDQAGTSTGLYYLFSTVAAIAGPIANGQVIERTGNNYNLIFLIAPFFFVIAFLLMLGVRHGEALPSTP
ncbi:MAG TPA: MFS transporter [Anaerolineales bacterium]|nr:MFS transporter [Anaerolineales bacterium]